MCRPNKVPFCSVTNPNKIKDDPGLLLRTPSTAALKMDDCDLEKLSVKPGSLSPKFNRNTTEYNVTVASDVAKLTISCLTSDSNACYQILVSKYDTLH